MKIITIDDPLYPEQLREITYPPTPLYVDGEAAVLSKPQIAIVGSRNPSIAGLELAKQFAFQLSQKGFIITSGLALGIDYASHLGALEANGKTIAVLGSGLDVIYPKRHVEIAKRIANQGAVISEFPPTYPPLAENFPRRNRIISGLSCGVLVVEAALKSGSLITARLALDQGREVFAIPGSVNNPLAKGCHLLLRQGAKLVETVDDILEEIAPQLPRETLAASRPALDSVLDKDYRILLQCLGFEPTPIDIVIIRSRLPAEKVAVMLLELEMSGFVKSECGRYFRDKLMET